MTHPNDGKYYVGYEKVHELCASQVPALKEFNPDMIIAIGGGGFIPGRILRSLLKEPGSSRSLPIQAIGLSLYEAPQGAAVGHENQIGKEVIRTQWIDFHALAKNQINIVGKRILIVDEVDDTRTTLEYALKELQADMERLANEQHQQKTETSSGAAAAVNGTAAEPTQFAIFVVHNKNKEKRGTLPPEIMETPNRYFAGQQIKDEWVVYPWDAPDIRAHGEKAAAIGNR